MQKRFLKLMFHTPEYSAALSQAQNGIFEQLTRKFSTRMVWTDNSFQ